MIRRHWLAAAIFVALTLAMTWPLAPNVGRAVADPGDPYITIWVLDWDWWATLHRPLSLFDANAFYPARYSLAFSENLYGVAMLLFPLRALGMGPIAAQNIALLAGFAFCGLAAYLLAVRLTRSFAAGLAAGIFYAFVPFRFVHLPHLQFVWGGWLPLLLVALLAYAEQPTRRRAAAFGVVFLFNGLTNIHQLLFGAFAAAVTAALLIPRKQWRDLLLATLAALALLSPFLYPYAAAARLYDMQRTWEEVYRFSAIPSDWLPGAMEPERRLYPGALALIAAAAALALVRKEAPKVALGLLWIAIGFFGSLGLHFEFHRFLFGAVPGFRAIRAPARWAVIAYVGLAILIALATAAIARRSRWLALLVPSAFVVELWVAPIRWYMANPHTPDVDRWLAAQQDSAIIELPIDHFGSEYAAMLHATAHHKPMVNGISGFGPEGRGEIARLANETPIPEALLDRLHDIGVDLVIVHADLLGERAEATTDWLRRELDRGRLSFVRRFDTTALGDWVFRIGRSAPAPEAQLDAFLAGRSTCGDSTMGALDDPPAGASLRGEVLFSGWTMSPYPIERADLWLDNHRVRHRADLVPADIPDRCPERPMTRRRFLALFPERPRSVHRKTDVQVEVTDGRGVRTLFEDRWIEWEGTRNAEHGTRNTER